MQHPAVAPQHALQGAANASTSASAAPTRSISDSFYEQAAHQNADGVVSLQKGDCGRAFHSFVATLTTLSHFRHYQMTTSPPPEPPLRCSPTSGGGKPRNCKAISIPYLEDSGFYIYSQAVIFSRKPRIGGQDTDGGDSTSVVTPMATHQRRQMDTIAFCEAAAQFNLGLAYHQRGKHCGEDKTLLGALELYEQALATLATIVATNSDETKILKLAVMNNRIHILNEMARYPQAQALVNDLLLQSVEALSSATSESVALSFLTRSDIDNFLLNALVIRRFNTAPCA